MSLVEVFELTWFICEEVTLWIMTCCSQQSFLSQLFTPTGSSTSFGLLTAPVTYPVMSQLVNTCFIRSFHSCQFPSVRWSRSAILLTFEYSFVRIKSTVASLRARN